METSRVESAHRIGIVGRHVADDVAAIEPRVGVNNSPKQGSLAMVLEKTDSYSANAVEVAVGENRAAG